MSFSKNVSLVLAKTFLLFLDIIVVLLDSMCSHYFENLKYSLQRLLNTLRFPCFLGISRPLRVHLSQSHSLHNVDGRERLFLWLKNPLEGKRSLPCLNLTTQPLKRLINLFLDGRNSYRTNFPRGASSWANWRAFQEPQSLLSIPNSRMSFRSVPSQYHQFGLCFLHQSQRIPLIVSAATIEPIDHSSPALLEAPDFCKTVTKILSLENGTVETSMPLLTMNQFQVNGW